MTPAGPRRSPDAILAELQQDSRARLRVYIGAAPGVGKTYSMLQDAHGLRAKGVDVVIGIVETYGRADTEAQVGDLEVVPRRQVAYRGVTLEELDVDAVIARRPQMCVVDELAHTNAPGSPRAKRYEDVLALLDAGIGVMTAVNIQHLETLNDAVARATGVRVRETVPDTFLERADEVVNVDVTVEELRTRLREGRVYRPEKIEHALTNFFRKGNLSTLRELALRVVADDVGDKAADYRAREGLEPPLIPERVMVCMSSNPEAPRVIRTGARIAGRLGSRWYAVYVETPAETAVTSGRRRRGAAAEHPARGVTRRDRRPRQRRQARRGPHRVRPARGRDPRHLRADGALALGAAVARVHARPVPRGGARRHGAGRAAGEVNRTQEGRKAGDRRQEQESGSQEVRKSGSQEGHASANWMTTFTSSGSRCSARPKSAGVVRRVTRPLSHDRSAAASAWVALYQWRLLAFTLPTQADGTSAGHRPRTSRCCPGGAQPYLPSTISTSVPQTPTATASTSIEPSRNEGSGMSSRRAVSGRNGSTVMAFMGRGPYCTA